MEGILKNRLEWLPNSALKRVLLFSIVVVTLLFLLEILFVGILVSYNYLNDRKIEQLKAQFLILQPIFANPIPKITSLNYAGFLGNLNTKKKMWKADPILGWRNGKNVGTTNTHGYGEGLEWRITNSQGFLPADSLEFNVLLRKPAGVYRIFVLGGSTVAGYGVKHPLENIVSQFAQSLKKKSKPPEGYTEFEIINAGVDGYFSTNQYLYFTTEIIRYDPDLIIFYDGWNDYAIGNPDPTFTKRFWKHKEMYDRLNNSYSVLGSGIQFITSIKNFFTGLSQQFATLWVPIRLMEKIFVDNSLVFVKDSKNGGYKVKNLIMQTVPKKTSPKMVNLYATNIDDAIAFSKSRSVKFAHFLQPILGISEKNPIGFELEWIQYNKETINVRRLYYEKIRKKLKKIKAKNQNSSEVCIDDLSLVFKDETLRIFSDSGHLNGKGNFVMAQNMVNSLLKCSILQNPRFGK